MPRILDPTRLDEGAGIEETMRKNKAFRAAGTCLATQNWKGQKSKKVLIFKSTLKTEGSTSTKLQRANHEAWKSECFCSKKNRMCSTVETG